MRNLFVILACVFLVGCSVVQPVISKIQWMKPRVQPIASASSNQFLDPVFPPSEKPNSNNQYPSAKPVLKMAKAVTAPALSSVSEIVPQKEEPNLVLSLSSSPLLFKYAQLLGQGIAQLPDSVLLRQIDPWMGVRYRNGGNTTSGIDCSAFTATILSNYRGVKLPRTSREQYHFCERIKSDELQVGDLLFFTTRGRSISHVGIYLGNDKFVHASSSNGVMVSDRKEPYFSTRFMGAGRVPAF